ncbi:hypothetical protein TeGR_g812 [Tetraparma gracilis]|uniref:HMA domain-containing protein n=1 Tax=Tetraparma gracilis TaxID=2962635 RepID=A0ABQ6M5P7_9STRA|nr:hypothetical protein TeGR_g812 [Tetraparma gracilis]
MSKLYLVTDPGFARSFAASFFVILASSKLPPLQTTVSDLHEHLRLLPHSYQLYFAVSFLASSCCLLQVVLSMGSFGCAGFNTVLGPARPTLLALASFLQLIAWREAAYQPFLRRPTMVGTIITLLLSFSPEFLMLYAARSPTRQVPEGVAGDFVLSLGDSMGCASCVTTVKKTIETNPGVLACNMVNNTATVYLRKDADQEGVTRTLKAALTARGFPPVATDVAT